MSRMRTSEIMQAEGVRLVMEPELGARPEPVYDMKQRQTDRTRTEIDVNTESVE